MQIKQITSEPLQYVRVHHEDNTFPKDGKQKRRERRAKKRKIN
jgi:hypothetical protein